MISDSDREAAATTPTIHPPRPLEVAAAQLVLLVQEPRAWGRALILAVRLSGGGVRSKLWHAFYFLEAGVLWRWARRAGVNHLHAHFANAASTVVLLAATLGERPGWTWSFTMHGPTEFDDITLFNLPEKVKRATFVACIGDYARSQLMKLVDAGEWPKLNIVRCGVDTSIFRPPPSTDDHGGPLRLLNIGRLVPDKAHEVLLHAVATLGGTGTQVDLRVVGDGPRRDGLEQLARDLGVTGNVRFMGALGQDRIRELYLDADVFVLPSFAEGIPVVLMEAMASGLPVITTRIAGIPELVEDGVSGLLIAPGRPDRLADAIRALDKDKASRRAMGRAGRRRVEGAFRVDRQVEILDGLLRLAVANR